MQTLEAVDLNVRLYVVNLTLEPLQPLTYRDLESVRNDYARAYVTGYGTAFVLVSLQRYLEIKTKFSTQQRFYPIALGPVHGLMWDGALVVPSDLVDDAHIGFMPVPSKLNILQR